MKVGRKNPEAAVAQLCPACGLCCNGVLFGDVRLQRDDDPERLAASGIRLKRKGRGQAFIQPCSCFDGKFCRIYEDRPVQCRAFECRLLQRVQAGELTAAAALKSIISARRQVGRVENLVRKLGNVDGHLPLNRRCARVIAEPIDLAADKKWIALRGELMKAVRELSDILGRDFLT